MSNKTIKLPLHCGKINASSKRQARVLFELKNGIKIADAEIEGLWKQFNELPENGEYVISEPSAYDNDHRVIVCEAGIFPYGKGQEIEGALSRENVKVGTVRLADGFYISSLHRGSLIFLSNKRDVREYVRKCCSAEIRHEMSRHEATEIVSKLSDEKIDLLIKQVWERYPSLPEGETSNAGADWHWNDRDA